MKFGYAKVATFSPLVKVGSVKDNLIYIKQGVQSALEQGAEVLVLPELSLTGYTCGDLFFSDLLIEGSMQALGELIDFSNGIKMLIFVGLPVKRMGRLYDSAAVIYNGKLLAIIPKANLQDNGSCAESRYFTAFCGDNQTISTPYGEVLFGNKVMFQSDKNDSFCVGVEISCDADAFCSPSLGQVQNGATLIVNLGAREDFYSERQTLLNKVNVYSNKLTCAYAYANAGVGESTSDCVYSGHSVISENGVALAQSKPFSDQITFAEVDLEYLNYKRGKSVKNEFSSGYKIINVSVCTNELPLKRKYEKTPFVPTDSAELKVCASKSIELQAQGLAQRLKHTNSACAVLGLSGGLDSTLAILVAVTAIKRLNRPTKDVLAITMPCFGTTSRTLTNSIKLAKALGVTLKKIDIGKAVTRHLKDIKHDGKPNVTFENAQARERTQVLMDVANLNGGLVVGTGDLSEVALGWSTYNGDHMSMYGVNCSVPKTLVRHLVEYYASNSRGKLKAVLLDILDTPVSPELLPVENDAIVQKTEDIVGPYILHDFFLYNFIERGFSPDKIYYLATQTFEGDFKNQTILKWLKIFFKRFFTQQFKRSCVPDGVKVGEISLSPRGSWKMPSDAFATMWLERLDNLDMND